MGNRLLGIAVFLCTVSFSFAAQKTVTANDANDLKEKCANAQAGDTIWVPAGDYDLSTSGTLDPGRTKDGWDRGLLWLGPNNGTAEHPIVLVGENPANPPSIHGQLNSDYSLIVHINNDYVILKNLKLHSAYAGINIDNANHVTIEDCEIYHTGQEIVHVRDGSTYVRLNRNHIHDSGNGLDKGTYGEGIYVGTSMESWGILGESPTSLWGETAKQYYSQNKPTYYDWRVNHVDISCNLMHAISSENIDIKEGTQDIVVSKNMFSADSLYLKSGPRDCDNSFVEVKGVRSTIVRNYLYTANNSNLTAYIDEYNRSGSGSNVPANLTPDKNSNIWCDNSASDGNQCGSGDNMFIGYIGEVRNLCSETFTIPGYPITYSDKKYQAVPAFPWVATSVSQKYEAENATIIEYASGRTDNPATIVANTTASGGSYVAMKNGNLQFNVNVSEKGKYNLIVHYSFATSDASAHKEQGLTVNGTYMGTLWFGVTDASKLTFKDVSTDIWLNDGTNTILLTRDWGWVDVDYIEVRGAGQYEELFPKQNVPASSSSTAVSSSSTQSTSSSSVDDISSSSMAEEGLAPQIGEKFDVVSVLGTKLRLKVPALGSFRVTVFDLNGNKVNKLSSGRYIVHVSARGYSKFTPVVIK